MADQEIRPHSSPVQDHLDLGRGTKLSLPPTHPDNLRHGHALHLVTATPGARVTEPSLRVLPSKLA